MTNNMIMEFGTNKDKKEQILLFKSEKMAKISLRK